MFDKNALKKLSDLSDSELKEKISVAMNASGVGGDAAKLSNDDIKKLRTTVSALSQKDIDNLMASIPNATIEEIKNKLSGK